MSTHLLNDAGRNALANALNRNALHYRSKETLHHHLYRSVLGDPAAHEVEKLQLVDLADGRSVVSFPIREYWLDIGNHDTYRQAQEDVAQGGRFHA